MPVHQWCSGNWSLGRIWVQRQEPAQQNSPATIWSQSGRLSVSKAPLLFVPRAAARHHTHDLNAERAKSLWRRSQRELWELLSPLGGLCLVAHCWKQQERLCKKKKKGNSSICLQITALIQVVMRHCAAQRLFDEVPAVISTKWGGSWFFFFFFKAWSYVFAQQWKMYSRPHGPHTGH